MLRKRGGSSRLSAEERLIEEQRAALLRKQKELEERLVKLPAVIEKQREIFEEQARKRAKQAAAPITPGRARPGRRGRRPAGTPARRAHTARIQAFALLCVFALIIFLVWRAIPQG